MIMYDFTDYSAYADYQALKNLHLIEQENFERSPNVNRANKFSNDVLEDIMWKNKFAQTEAEQERRAFLSDPDYRRY